jgi:hypothetical protein
MSVMSVVGVMGLVGGVCVQGVLGVVSEWRREVSSRVKTCQHVLRRKSSRAWAWLSSLRRSL